MVWSKTGENSEEIDILKEKFVFFEEVEGKESEV